MLESVAEKFKRLGCSFLEKVDVSSNNAWINDLFLQPTQDRKKLLLWCLKTVDPSFELMRVDEFLSATGICKSADESKSFVVGEMSRQRQVLVWDAFARLIDEENLEFEEITEMQSNNCNFIDVLAEKVNFQKQAKSPLEITPYHLERELKSRKMVDAPPIKVFKNVLSLAETEKSNLLQFDASEHDVERDDHEVLLKLESKSDEIFDKKEGFDLKFRTELEPWLTGRSVTSIGSKDRPEVKIMEEALEKIGNHFSNNLTITNSAHQVTKASEEILNVLAYSTLVDNSVLDIENINLLSDLNLTRAPAAS